jgi:hypothetical protein
MHCRAAIPEVQTFFKKDNSCKAVRCGGPFRRALLAPAWPHPRRNGKKIFKLK